MKGGRQVTLRAQDVEEGHHRAPVCLQSNRALTVSLPEALCPCEVEGDAVKQGMLNKASPALCTVQVNKGGYHM